MSPIDSLTHIFKMFPGIGERQARRFVYFLLSRDTATRAKLASTITELAESITQCTDCRRFFAHHTTPKALCGICSDTARDATTILIVARDTDLENIEASKTFTGKYFVLGGTAPIRAENLATEPYLHAHELTTFLKRVRPHEVILGFATSPEGDHTANLVVSLLTQLKFETPFVISRLGRGLSAGAELEYADPTTLKAALDTRTE